MIRPIKIEEQSRLIELAAQTDAFKEGEAEELLGYVLGEYFADTLAEGHQMLALEDDQSKVIAWSYFAPSLYADGVWDVWWIGVDSKCQSKGYGQILLEKVEEKIKQNKGRVIVIETSSLPGLKKARNFYPKMNYAQCGVVPNFYGDKDDKVIFSKNV